MSGKRRGRKGGVYATQPCLFYRRGEERSLPIPTIRPRLPWGAGGDGTHVRAVTLHAFKTLLPFHHLKEKNVGKRISPGLVIYRKGGPSDVA